MFVRLSHWIVASTVICALSACGGGQADQSAGIAMPPQQLAVAPVAVEPLAQAAPSAAADNAIAATATVIPSSVSPTPGREVQFAYTAAVEMASIQPQAGMMSTQQSGASQAAALAAAQQARMADLAAAEQAARWQAAMGNSDDEALLAMIRYHENAERQAALTGVRHRKPSDPDCVSPRQMMCAND